MYLRFRSWFNRKQITTKSKTWWVSYTPADSDTFSDQSNRCRKKNNICAVASVHSSYTFLLSLNFRRLDRDGFWQTNQFHCSVSFICISLLLGSITYYGIRNIHLMRAISIYDVVVQSIFYSIRMNYYCSWDFRSVTGDVLIPSTRSIRMLVDDRLSI